MFTLSPTELVLGGLSTVLGIAFTGWVLYAKGIVKDFEKSDEENAKKIDDLCVDVDARIAAAVASQTAALRDLKESLGERLTALHQKLDGQEARLAQIERTYLSRAEHAEFRMEMLASVEKVGTMVNSSINGLASRLEHLVERIAKVEAGQT